MPWYLPAAFFLLIAVVLVTRARLGPWWRSWRANARYDREQRMLLDYYKNGAHRTDAGFPPRIQPRAHPRRTGHNRPVE